MSSFTKWTGQDAAKRAQQALERDLAESHAQREEFKKAEDTANAAKTAQQQKINSKSANAARNSMRRPGFLDSSQEGISDVLG